MHRVLTVSSFVLAGLLGCGSSSSDHASTTPATTSAAPAPSGDITTQAEQQAMTPAEVIADLKAGNARFVRGETTPRDHLAQVKGTAAGQYPKAVVLSCLDSRVPAELVFDQGIGDLFVARVAGNFENEDILGSMEFATAAAGSKAIVVLGHTSCGAIKGACDGVELGNLTATLANIAPAIAASQGVPGEHTSKNHAYVHAVTEANIDQTVRDITERSPVLKDLVDKGALTVVGALYDLETGQVTWR
ncbi:MAG: carbonic anhydrase family protein [Kofleriaceae bacterium]